MLTLLIIIKNLFAFFRAIAVLVLVLLWLLSIGLIVGFIALKVNDITWSTVAMILTLIVGLRYYFKLGRLAIESLVEYSQKFYPWIEGKIFKVSERMVG